MSICVNIRTAKIIEPKIFLEQLADSGEQIIVTSNEYPCVKFGNYGTAIRGIEVNKEDNGMEVRICAMASKADYQLFAKTVDMLIKATGAKAFLEDCDDDEITNPLETFNNDWIDYQRKASINITRAMIKYNGEYVTYFGLFSKFCLGPKMGMHFAALSTNEYSLEDVDDLEQYLCYIQAECAEMKDTSTRLAISAPSGNPDKALTISMISISDGKVNDFDYISWADLLGIIDMDNDELAPAFIPFDQAWKILPRGVFTALDEVQYRRKEELTIDMVHKMMDNARCLRPDDLHYRPTYPGQPLDGKQNTFILKWNPAISSLKLEDHQLNVKEMFIECFNWSVWEHDKAKCGDRFYLVRVGEGNTGIVMSGVFESQPYEGGDWSGKGRQTFYMDMKPNIILDPENAPMVTTAELQQAIPTFEWTRGHSGAMLTPEEAQALETLWEEFIEKHSSDIDGVTMNARDINH